MDLGFRRETLLSAFGPDLLYFKNGDDSEKKSPFEACINLTPNLRDPILASKLKDHIGLNNIIFRQTVSVQLKFCWTENHSENVPSFEITRSDGLSDNDRDELMKFLLKLAKMWKGSEFIFKLCARCKQYLEKSLAKNIRQYFDSFVLGSQDHGELRKQFQRHSQARKAKDEKDRLLQNLDSHAQVLLVKNIHGENITICKMAGSIILKRKPLHKFCTEWYGYDQEHCEVILVSEWKFVCTSAGRKHDWQPFVNELRNFITQLTENAKKIDKMGSFLHPYVFVHLQETSIKPTNFNASIFIGQAISENDFCCVEPPIYKKEVASIAVQIVKSLKYIHSLKLGHGHLSVDSLWKTYCFDFRLSDAFIFPATSDLCTLFEEITQSLSSSASTKWKLEQRNYSEIQQEDLSSLKTLLKSLSPRNFDNNSAVKKFIEFCNSVTSIEELADHELVRDYKPPFMKCQLDDSNSDAVSFPENWRLVEEFDNFRKLGKGGYGHVYLARNKLENKSYALKVIKSKDKMERITREVELLSELNHEHVVRYYGAWLETSDIEKILIIRMEYCEKGTLRNLINSEDLLKSDELTWRLFDEIRNGLHFIHEKRIFHRDIKPENIFLDSNMKIKIGDFGLARLLSTNEDGPNLSSNVGTSYYAAPEISTGNYDEKCDVYSFGVVLFEMLYRPLRPGGDRETNLRKLKENFVFPKDFENFAQLKTWIPFKEHIMGLKKLISSMIQRDPKDRPKTSDLLNHECIPIFNSEENDFEKNLKKELQNRSSKVYHNTLLELFSSKMSSEANHYYDSGIIKYNGMAQFAKEKEICKITEELRKTFHLHGFHELSGHMVIPGSLTRYSQADAFRVLEETGFTVSVCPNLRTNFIRFCDENFIEFTKRFSIGKILRSNEDPGLHPFESMECAVDIVAPTSSSRKMAKEIITLLIDLQNNVRMLSESKPILYLGHSKLLESICISNGCTDSTMLYDISDCLHKLTFSDEASLKEQVERLQEDAKISFTMASSISEMIKPAENFEELKARFQNLLQHETKEIKDPANIAINEISQLLDDLPSDYHQKMFIVFHPGLPCYPDIFNDGLIYLSKLKVPWMKDPVFWGGRYASVLSSKRYIGDLVTSVSAYGLNISIENLLRIQEKTSPSFVFSTLVYPITSDAEEKADEIVQELRQNGISSSVYYGYPSADALFSYCEAMKIPCVLTISSDCDDVVFYKDIKLTKSSEKGTYKNYDPTEMTREDVIETIKELKAQSYKSSNEKPSLSEEPTTSDKMNAV